MRVRSGAEKAALVAEYLGVQHGQKMIWLKERGIAHNTMGEWRKGYFYGDLERELIPRDTSGMTVSEGARIRQLELLLAQEKAARESDRARHETEVERLNQVTDALGKAIGLLHDHAGVQEPTDGS